MDFFQRAYSLQVDSFLIDKLRVSFDASKSLEKEPNRLELKIFNLSEPTRGKLKGKGLPVVLSAGYVDSKAIIFAGDSRTIDHKREGADWITTITCGDGERAYATARFSASLPKGVTKADVIRKAIKSFGVNAGNSENLLKDLKGAFSKGFAVNTNTAASLTSLCESVGLKWSIQDGEIQLRNDNDPVGNVAVVLSPSTGLIGSPEISAPKDEKKAAILKVKCFLNHRVRCGSEIQLQSAAFNNARFRVEKLKHNGDSEAEPWYTEAELKAL